MSLNISNIQHFSLGDGEGIRTTVFFKGCNLHCPWCHNPETLSYEPTHMFFININKSEIRGKLYTEDEIFQEILKDKDYYDASEGGVTFSGGEVMLYADKLVPLAEMLKKENISIIVDTAGNVDYSAFSILNPFVNEYLYDFKTASREKYKNVIGGDLDLVADNIKKLISDNKKVTIRIPLIPDFNTDSQSINDMCIILKNSGVTNVDLLPFHRLGSAKYEAMRVDYKYKNTELLSDNELNKIKKQFLQYFNVRIEQ